MTGEIALVLIVAVSAVVLFVTERFRVDVVAMLVMLAFISTGVLTPDQGISGFGNAATVTVAAMFVLAAGIQKTGALEAVAQLLLRHSQGSLYRANIILMVVVGFLSAFINNTAAVAVFLPITIELSKKAKLPASKLLIPLSFASLFGGACTLVGSSTNILVSSLSSKYKAEPISMFEMAPLGLILATAGVLYMMVIGIRLLPDRVRLDTLAEDFKATPYLTEFMIPNESDLIGKMIGEGALGEDNDVSILQVKRGQTTRTNPPSDFVLKSGDIVRSRCGLQTLVELNKRDDIIINPQTDEVAALDSIVEGVVAPGSFLIDRSLNQIDARQRFQFSPIALKRRGLLTHSNISNLKIRAGDVLLFNAPQTEIEKLKRSHAFVMVSQLEQAEARKSKMPFALAAMACVVLLASTGVSPIVVASLLGCAAMILTKCLTPDEAYDAIDWKVIMLLGGMLTLGSAMEESGAAKLLASGLLKASGDMGPWFVMSALYLTTSFLTEALSNNATAVMLVPIAYSAADSLGVDARPLIMAITFAASSSFMTPVGYQTNTLVYGPGQYTFKDFLKVGIPLNLLFWVIASVMIPRIWPF